MKVIGNQNGQFFGGETDLRGVFVAEGVRGQVTAVARRGDQYAFYRGHEVIGVAPPAPSEPACEAVLPEVKTWVGEHMLDGQDARDQMAVRMDGLLLRYRGEVSIA